MSEESRQRDLTDPHLLRIRRWIHETTGVWYKDNRLWVLSERLKNIEAKYNLTLLEVVHYLQQTGTTPLQNTRDEEISVNHT